MIYATFLYLYSYNDFLFKNILLVQPPENPRNRRRHGVFYAEDDNDEDDDDNEADNQVHRKNLQILTFFVFYRFISFNQ